MIARRTGAGVAALLFATTAIAAELPAPAGRVVLSVSGDIEHTTDGSSAHFDLAMLEALGMTTVQTSTPWTAGVVRFEGPLARAVMAAVGARGKTATAIALNDYHAEVPLADFERHDVILAIKADGEYMPVRDKGPIFVVYPFDHDSALRSEIVYARSVWQLRSLRVH